MNVIQHQLQTVHILWNPMDPTLHPTQDRTALLRTQVSHTQHNAKKKQELMRFEILMVDHGGQHQHYCLLGCDPVHLGTVCYPAYGGSRYLQNVCSFFWTTGSGVTSHKTAVLKEERNQCIQHREYSQAPILSSHFLHSMQFYTHAVTSQPSSHTNNIKY
jgi:hypothetical protein